LVVRFWQSLEGVITLFNTKRRISSQIIARWRNATSQPLENILIPGYHGNQYQNGVLVQTTFIDEPHVQTLAELFKESIDKASNLHDA